MICYIDQLICVIMWFITLILCREQIKLIFFCSFLSKGLFIILSLFLAPKIDWQATQDI